MARARSEDFRVTDVRLAFPALLKPRKREGKKGAFLQYDCTLLFPKTAPLIGRFADKSETPVMDIAGKVATDEWGDKAIGWIKDGLIHNPFLDGDGPQGVNKKTGERHVGFAGHRFIRCSANEDYPPKLVDRQKKAITSADGLYPGCFVIAVLNIYTWENTEKGKGLSFGVSIVQFSKDGERLGGGGANPDNFLDAIDDEGGAPEATKGGAGAGGLFA